MSYPPPSPSQTTFPSSTFCQPAKPSKAIHSPKQISAGLKPSSRGPSPIMSLHSRIWPLGLLGGESQGDHTPREEEGPGDRLAGVDRNCSCRGSSIPAGSSSLTSARLLGFWPPPLSTSVRLIVGTQK